MSNSPCARTYSANRAACARNAAADLADTIQGSTGSAGASACAGSAAGTASMMTCALVPLMPNDDTPARRGRSPGHGWASVNNDTAPADQSTCGLGSSTCSVAGNNSWRIASTILITPATPAAA
ncbi:hypothetical protein PICSAR240_04569 [Mycobacterium avium subsp. paratuberculosis]|nr:hypothetical protein PICSAR124B_04566 [Mycobacterium avium subsp. paratuberculosis]CAG6937522.1 hypothetical protein PICSAR103_04507 [Mycobacterium avium subsp. paratuberculosis]CAG6937537.1 hypothetical protein PICSAR102_04574 [Mycobacterium avium subsp. paratuberculosis]CAG6937574.1 hypothetical protein PICSAR117_04562 [Mycobacterium avium subsp. paratuberculosis]CAG6937664.1 hypothetical protein PICSAR110_04581 [Mycobacterium avium subsp. paratuberculosis]